MVSGIFMGGVASGFDKQEALSNQYNYQQGLLQLEQQRQQQQQQNQQRAEHMKLRADAVGHLEETMTALRNAHPDWGPMQIASNPAIVSLKDMIGGFDKNLGLPSTIDSIVAALAERPSALGVLNAPTARRAGNPQPASPQAGVPGNPDLDTGTQLGGKSTTFNQRFAQDDVDRLTRALSLTGDNAGLRAALGARLQDALRRQGSDTEFKVIKDENGNEHPVFVDARNRTVTGLNGQPYVAPTGDEDSDSKRIATAIKEGRQPPTTTGLYRDAKKVRAQLERQDVNLSELQLEWDSAQKQVKSLNGPQMVRYAGLAKSVLNTIDETNSLADQMDNSGVPLYNRARLAKYIQTEGNSDNGQLAAKYLASVNTLKEEFANLAQGGYAPTEAAWGLANQQINGDYGRNELKASLGEVQRLLRFRLQGIPNFQTLGPGASNRYVGGGNSEQPSAPTVDVKKLSDDELRAIVGAH